MNKKQIFSLFLILILLCSLFASCGGKENGEDASVADITSGTAAEGTSADAGEEESSLAEAAELPVSELKAVKTNSFSLANSLEYDEVYGFSVYELYTEIRITDNAIIVHDKNGKYRILSKDGKSDTGAVYTAVSGSGMIFDVDSDPNYMVTKSEFPLAKDPASLNCFSLVDAYGKEIFPAEYAAFEALNERFVYAIKVTSATEESLNYLYRFQGDLFGEDSYQEYYYNGSAVLYDLETMQPVPGFTAASYDEMADDAYGAFIIKYSDTDYSETYYDAKGNKLDSIETVYLNGSYSVQKDGSRTVFSAEGKELFVYDPSLYNVDFGCPYFYYQYVPGCGYYCFSSKQAAERTVKCYFLDENGEKCSPEFILSAEEDDLSDLEYYDLGNYCYLNGKLYDKEGNRTAKNLQYISVDPFFDRGYFLLYENMMDFYAPDGSFLRRFDHYSDGYLDDMSGIVDRLDCNVLIPTGESEDLRFPVGWFASVKGETEGTEDFIDLYNGEKLITGYLYYDCDISLSGETIVIAFQDPSTVDLYRIQK